MYNTRFMSRLFSATEEGDEKLTEQVSNDIECAKKQGCVDTDEVRYDSVGNGNVAVTDKENGEVTIAERDANGDYDLRPASQAELESFLHPGSNGVTPGQLNGETSYDWEVDAHMDGNSVIAPNVPGGGLNPEAGHERRVADMDIEDEREFSVASNNAVVQKVFADQYYWEKTFSEVIESEETAKVGDLKVEKDPTDDNAVIVTSESTGDQAKVVLDDDEMEVTELEEKDFSYYVEDGVLYRYYSGGEEGDEDDSDFSTEGPDEFDQLHVVGVDAGNHVMVDAPEYDQESAEDLAARLTEQGVQGVEIFDNAEDARDYAADLLENLGVESENDVEEPEQAEFSDHTVYLTRFYSSNSTDYMVRLFSEAAEGDSTSQDVIEDAIESGEEIENDGEIITPVNSTTAIIVDKENGEFTKATLNGEDLNLDEIDAQAAAELTNNVVTGVDEEEYNADDERDFSDVYCDATETRFFSEHEVMTNYMVRLYSGDADEKEIESAIEDGEQVENENEVITPIDSTTAVIEDKESGEFTKAVMDDDKLDLEPISEDEADELTENLEVEDEKDFSDVYCNDEETKYFSENELMSDYMVRLYSEEADEKEIENAIEDGEQVETEDEVITPINSTTAVIEDKDNGEFTKAVMDDDKLDLEPISEDEADELTDGLAVEDDDEDEKEFSYSYYETTGDPVLDKFFAEVAQPQQAMPMPPAAPVPVGAAPMPPAAPAIDPATGQPIDPNAMPPVDENGNPIDPAMVQGPTIESIEDKAVAAVQSIQAAAAEAEATIMNAKAAPVQQAEPNLQEAQFGYYDEDEDVRYFSENSNIYNNPQDTLVSWLNGTQRLYR